MPVLGEVLREIREAHGFTGRELGRRSGLSHTQIARIESGTIASPAGETLTTLAQALNVDSRPLKILAGHVTGDAAHRELHTLFADHAPMLEEWDEWANFSIEEARAIVSDPHSSEENVQLLAADLLRWGDSEENMPLAAGASLAGEGDLKVRTLLETWHYLDEARCARVLEYASSLRHLQELEFDLERERLRLDAASITEGPGSDGQASAVTRARFGEDFLRELGFEGFVRVLGLPTGAMVVPDAPGVYAVVRRDSGRPDFLQTSVGGHFKGKEPSVSLDTLRERWVEDAPTVYLGRAGRLRQRLNLLARFGRGEPVAHWGGRYLWQLADYDQLLVCWLATGDQVQREAELIADFGEHFSSLPFANLNQPRSDAR